MKLLISAHRHIKNHVNIVNATIWSLVMCQWYIMTIFHYNIEHDVEKESLNDLNMCLINILDIYYVILLISS